MNPPEKSYLIEKSCVMEKDPSVSKFRRVHVIRSLCVMTALPNAEACAPPT